MLRGVRVSVAKPGEVEAGQWSMAGRIRPAITSLDTTLAEAIHARLLEPSRRTPAARRRDYGSTLA